MFEWIIKIYRPGLGREGGSASQRYTYPCALVTQYSPPWENIGDQTNRSFWNQIWTNSILWSISLEANPWRRISLQTMTGKVVAFLLAIALYILSIVRAIMCKLFVQFCIFWAILCVSLVYFVKYCTYYLYI